MTGSSREAFQRDGRIWLRRALDPEALQALSHVADLRAQPGRRMRVCDLGAAAPAIISAISPVFSGARAVRVVGFSKGNSANWGVPWHQDRVVSVSRKEELPGWRGWSNKGGVWHCEPPIEFLD